MSTRSSQQLMRNPSDDRDSPLMKQRRTIRYVTAALAAAVAVIYFLIGFRVVSVLEIPQYQDFGLAAGCAYALGAILLVLFDYRVLWVLGAVLQAVVIFTYFDVASVRTPTFELWGILIRIAQVIILIGLIALEIRRPLPPPEKPIED